MDLLEGDPGGCLEGTTPANAVDASLSAAEGAGNLPEVSGGDAAAVGIVELGCIAELEGFDAGFEGGLAEQIEALEERDVVLDIARSAELVPARVAQPDVGRGTGGTGAAGGLGERCRVEPVSVGADAVRDLNGATRFAVWVVPGVLRVPPLAVTVKGSPETMEMMPETFHPPRARAPTPELRKLCPRPAGSS